MKKKTKQFLLGFTFVMSWYLVSIPVGELTAGKDAVFCQIIFMGGLIMGGTTSYLLDLVDKKYNLS